MLIKHKIIDILKYLPEIELRNLKRFIHSPYFNRSPKINLLFNELVRFYPLFNDKNLTKEKILNKISKGKKYNDSTFRGLMFDLLQIIYRFLVVEGFGEDSLEMETNIIKKLYAKRHFSQAKLLFKKADDLSERADVDYDFYLHNYFLESYRYNIDCQMVPIHNKKQASRQLYLLSNSDLFLFLFFVTELIFDYISTVVFASKYNLDILDCFTSQIISSIDLNKIVKSVNTDQKKFCILDLHVASFHAFDKLYDKKYYLSYKKKVKQHIRIISHEEMATHYSNLINNLNLKINKKFSPYYQIELFKIYEEYLKNEYYLDAKISYLKPSVFRTILLNALQCKKYTWAEHFINVYSKRVPENLHHDMYHFGYALWYKAVGKDSEALEYIEKIGVKEFMFKYDTYNLKLKIYLEYSNPEIALDYIRTYSEYLRKDKFFSEPRKANYKQFIKFTKEIINYKEGKRGIDIGFIKKQLEESGNVINKEWLLEKISVLSRAKTLQKYG